MKKHSILIILTSSIFSFSCGSDIEPSSKYSEHPVTSENGYTNQNSRCGTDDPE